MLVRLRNVVGSSGDSTFLDLLPLLLGSFEGCHRVGEAAAWSRCRSTSFGAVGPNHIDNLRMPPGSFRSLSSQKLNSYTRTGLF